MKTYRIQVRTEVYETYIIKVDQNLDEDTAFGEALSKLDTAFSKKDNHHVMDDAYVEESFRDFGGFTSIEEKKSGTFIRVLGEPIKRELPNKETFPKQTNG